MCGILCFKVKNLNSKYIIEHFVKKNDRGPDNTSIKKIEEGFYFLFHRLAINDLSSFGNQPMTYENITLICNGQIYNYQRLVEKYKLKLKSTCDCEVILHLYKILPFQQLLSELDGVFSFVIYDKEKDLILAARDSFGVRPLFYGKIGEEFFLASEMKYISQWTDVCHQVKPGTFIIKDKSEIKTGVYFKLNINFINDPLPTILENVRSLLFKAVKKRLLSDRPIGALLSGGLDSSLICCILKKLNVEMETFSIGFADSEDLHHAKNLAQFHNFKHHEVILPEETFLNAIPKVIYQIESYDITTVRASVGNYLLAKYISSNSECKVIFSGEGSDEQSGYKYLENAPTHGDFHEECLSLLENLYYFDLLRSDRTISSQGLEVRVPFLDKDFVNYYMSIRTPLKMYSKDIIEKNLLRMAFSRDDDFITKDILFRRKCAFSDGVSSESNSWHNIIKKFVDTKISNTENYPKYNHIPPVTSEGLYYRLLFEKYFPNKGEVIPHYWMPKWTSLQNEPSARDLNS